MAVKWFDKQTDKGVLKYRYPNIQEGFDFLSAIQEIRTLQDSFRVKGNFIGKMKSMIDYASLGYESWEDFLDDRDNNFDAMKDIADEVFIEVTKVLTKKHSSSTP